MNTDSFANRHLGPRNSDLPKMLQTIGVDSMEQLIEQTVPDDILLSEELQLDEAMSEQEYLEHINELASLNSLYKTYIGLGYHQSITPPVIQRNILENPGWYTAYTPYQAEIAQGRQFIGSCGPQGQVGDGALLSRRFRVQLIGRALPG